jgi:hypothetical protein
MDPTITQVTDMRKKKPNQVSPESTIWPAECFEQEPAKTGVASAVRDLKTAAREIRSMSFIGLVLGVGKEVELWDSNVHRVICTGVPKTASAQGISQLRH